MPALHTLIVTPNKTPRPRASPASFDAYGAYARLDVPLLVDEMRRAGSLSMDVDHELLLYTDFDIVFAAGPTAHLLALPPPPAYYAVPGIARAPG